MKKTYTQLLFLRLLHLGKLMSYKIIHIHVARRTYLFKKYDLSPHRRMYFEKYEPNF